MWGTFERDISFRSESKALGRGVEKGHDPNTTTRAIDDEIPTYLLVSTNILKSECMPQAFQ